MLPIFLGFVDKRDASYLPQVLQIGAMLPIWGSISTEIPLPHLVRFGCATLVSAVCSFTLARRRHIGVAVAIAAETPWKRRDW